MGFLFPSFCSCPAGRDRRARGCASVPTRPASGITSVKLSPSIFVSHWRLSQLGGVALGRFRGRSLDPRALAFSILAIATGAHLRSRPSSSFVPCHWLLDGVVSSKSSIEGGNVKRGPPYSRSRPTRPPRPSGLFLLLATPSRGTPARLRLAPGRVPSLARTTAALCLSCARRASHPRVGGPPFFKRRAGVQRPSRLAPLGRSAPVLSKYLHSLSAIVPVSIMATHAARCLFFTLRLP